MTFILNCKDSNQTFCRTLQLMVMYHNTNSGCKRFNRSEGMSQSCSRLLNSVTLTLTVKTEIPSFLMTPQFLNMHHIHNTKHGCKGFSAYWQAMRGKNEPPRWFQVCEFSTTTSREKLTSISIPSIYHFWTLLSQVRF